MNHIKNMSSKPRALVSVTDKTGIVDLCGKLVLMGYEIVSTGGTALTLRSNGIAVTEVSEITNIPEMLDGRVKTLNNLVFGGILAKRDGSHDSDIAKYDIPLFEIVIVNLYPFESVISARDVSVIQAIENIDIGGVSLLRAGAKNYQYVWSVSSIIQYDRLITGLGFKQDGNTLKAIEIRKQFAVETFKLISHYDRVIANYLALSATDKKNDNGCGMPDNLYIEYEKIQEMRYGENSHQLAAMYKPINIGGVIHYAKNGIINAVQHQGKELSYNNIVDADSALQCANFIANQFAGYAVCVIVKHNNPCGVALAASYEEAYRKAFKTDPTSAFGGIIAFAHSYANIDACVNSDIAKYIIDNQFAEVIIGPGFTRGALDVFAKKPNIRILSISGGIKSSYDIKSISGGGILYQTSDNVVTTPDMLNVKSQKQPTNEEQIQMIFAWCVAKYVKSNAIIFVKDNMTIGIGAGQMSRIDSTRLAIMKAKNSGLDVAGCVVASDAFFPFRDGVDAIYDVGATCIIQPGGSIKDKEVIQAADEHNGVMVFTGIRHFRH